MTEKLLSQYDVVIVGGGVTGAGVARDCAMRGMSTLLVESHDLTYGTTGRNHGLMHSGARYAVTDLENARECIEENKILCRIARHCVEPTGGLFISLPEDDLAYQARLVESCHEAGINAEVIDAAEARRIEPAVNPTIVSAVLVPDASIDPFKLTMSNVLDAQLHGATVLTYHEVVAIHRAGNAVTAVTLRDNLTREQKRVDAGVVINAAGIWSTLVAKLAGVELKMLPARGALLLLGQRVNTMVINRCRKPANADILVPTGNVCVLGTTSRRVPIEEIEDMSVTVEEAQMLLTEGVKLAPAIARTRVLRAYAGVRPLVADDDDPTGRNVSRGISCIDHSERDGVENFITITGGKMMTYRLMAQMATDLACKKLRLSRRCATATTALPGSDSAAASTSTTWHDFTISKPWRHDKNNRLLCTCEGVTEHEVETILNEDDDVDFDALRRRTRLGMGPCQGRMCACRVARKMCARQGEDEAMKRLVNFMNERWKGMRPVTWSDTLSEAYNTALVYQDLCGVDQIMKTIKEKEI